MSESIAKLAARLRALVIIDEVNSNNALGREAADALEAEHARAEAAEARVKALEEVLRPFATDAGRYDPMTEGDDRDLIWDYGHSELRVGDLRRARSVLKETSSHGQS